jgi:single-strand DNA-binding protein
MGAGYINVTVVGTIGKDPEIRSTGSGKKVANFSVAVDQGFGDSKKTEWVNILCWEKLAELAEKYLKKGKVIALSGTLQTSSWDDKQSGQKRYKTEVVARDITFMDSGSSGGGSPRQERSAPAPQTRQAPAPSTRGPAPADTSNSTNDWDESAADDIPF